MSENKQTTDSELLLQIVGYNSEAFEHLYNRYSATIYCLIKEIVTNQKLAEKILLNVFSVFLKRLDYYSTTSNDIYTWLTLLARNISLDALKRMKFVEDIPDYSDEYEVEFILPNLSEVITPIDLDQRTEFGEKIKSYKSHLTEVQNLVLSLVYFEGLNEEEIAKRLSVPVITVRQKTLSIMESLHNQYTGKSEDGNKKVSPLVKLEALGCLSSEERKLLSELRKNDPDFLWKELGEYQNLTALLATTISIEYPGHELNSEIRDIFIKISGGGEVDYKIMSSEHTLISQIQEPIKETIQQKIQNPISGSVVEQIHSKIQTPAPEAIQHKVQNPLPESVPKQVQHEVQIPAIETVQQKIQNPVSEPVPEPIQQKIESPIPVTNKHPELQEKKKSEFELKFRERDPKELSLLRHLEKNDSSKKPAEVLAKTNNDIKLKSYNAAEKKPGVFVDKKVDLSIDKKLTPALLKTEILKPPTPFINTNKTELEIKNDDPSIIIDKPKPAVLNEEVTVKNRLIPNSSINLKEFLKNEERKKISKESSIANIKEEDKTEVKPVQPVIDKPVLENKSNEPIKEIHKPNVIVAKEQKKVEDKPVTPVVENSEIKIKSNEPPKEFRSSNVFVDKYQKTIPGKPVEPNVNKSEPQAKKDEPIKEIQKINDIAAKSEKPVEIKSPQVVKRDDVQTPVQVPQKHEEKTNSASIKDEKAFQQIKPAVNKSNLKIRETVFTENENKNDIVNKEIEKPVTASKQVIEKVNTSSKITESINIDEILSKIENEKPAPPILSETESYEKEIIRLRKKLRRNILVSAAVFVILAASSIFVYLNFKEVPAKVVDKGTNTEKVNLAAQTNLILNDEYKPEIETENPGEKNENVLLEQPLTKQKVLIPPLPEISTKEESTLFAANVNNSLTENEEKEPTQIAAAKTEKIVPPKENKVVEEEPAFFVAVEEMPELIGGIKGLQSKIVYPEIAKRVGVEGKVIVQAIVDETGKVVSVNTIKGIGSGCDEVAMDAVRNSKFTPGKQRGKTVKTQVTIPIVFKK
ncbi:MAG: TonB family protein [Ignavibacterium sp.]|nr:TonB family protein [Ignavibacterium sp.]